MSFSVGRNGRSPTHVQPLLYRRPVSGSNRDVDFKSVREVIALIEHLETQGARVDWGGKNRGNGGVNADGSAYAGTFGKFPAKVYPPDKTKHFILFHGSQSDRNSATLKRNEVRRAGLTWPGDDVPRKETPMSIAPPTHLRQHGHHLMQPAGARQMKHPPTPETAGRFLPVVGKLADGFWTDDVLKALNDAKVPGYGANGAMQRVQGLLDWAGYRVTEVRRNRNGWAYRWAHEAVARAMAEPRVTPIRPQVEEPVQKQEAPKPIAQLRTKQHERKFCADCARWFAPVGYDNHVVATGHGATVPAATLATDTITVVPTFVPDPEPEPAAEPLQPETTTMQQTDLDAMEALATEAQEEAAELRRQLTDANEAYGRLTEKFAGEREEREDLRNKLTRTEYALTKAEDSRENWHSKADEASALLGDARTEHARALEDLSAAHDEAIEQLRESAGSPDGSWVIDPASITDTLADLQRDGLRFGLIIETRARRA